MSIAVIVQPPRTHFPLGFRCRMRILMGMLLFFARCPEPGPSNSRACS
jgi:hypothetical protein